MYGYGIATYITYIWLMFMFFMQVTIPYMDAMGMLITCLYSQNVKTTDFCRAPAPGLGRYIHLPTSAPFPGLGIFGYLELRHLRADDFASVTQFDASLGGLEHSLRLSEMFAKSSRWFCWMVDFGMFVWNVFHVNVLKQEISLQGTGWEWHIYGWYFLVIIVNSPLFSHHFGRTCLFFVVFSKSS